MPKELVINDWQKGIAESPLVGFGDMRNVDLYSQFGALKVNPKLQLSSQTSVQNLTVTVNTGTDIFTSSSAHNLKTGSVVVISSSGSLPSPLSSGDRSYVIVQSSTTFKIANSLNNALAGTALDITTAGTGTITASTIDMGRTTNFAYDSVNNYIFAQDENGRVWRSTTSAGNWYLIGGNTLTGAAGNGLVVWKSYIFAFRNTAIDVTATTFNPGASSSWTYNSWRSLTITSATSHYAIWGQDDILYYANGRTLGSVQEVAGADFDPNDTATFVNPATTTAVLSLPENVTSSKIEELGTNLMTLASDNTYSYVFPWDRTSPTFNLPLRVQNSVSTMTAYNQTLYLFATDVLKVYKTNGSYMTEEEIFPQSWLGTDITSVSIGASTVFKGRLLFSISQAGTASTGPNGVYSYDLKTGALVMENGISTGNYYAGVQISALYAPKQSGMYFVGWKDNNGATTSYGIDNNRLSGPANSYVWYSSYESYVETQLYEIGTPQDTRQLQELSLTFSNKLAATQGVRLSYRTNLTDSYTLIGTYDFSTLGAVQTYTGNFSSTGSTHIQFKIELSDAAGTMGLLALKLR